MFRPWVSAAPARGFGTEGLQEENLRKLGAGRGMLPVAGCQQEEKGRRFEYASPAQEAEEKILTLRLVLYVVWKEPVFFWGGGACDVQLLGFISG